MPVVKNNPAHEPNTPKTPGIHPFDLFSQMPTTTSWTGASQQYIETIRNTLEDKSASLGIEMRRIPSYPDALVFVSKKKNTVILLLDRGSMATSFDDSDLVSYRNENRFVEVRRQYEVHFDKHNLINIVLVNKFMLDRPMQMANYIGKTLLAVDQGGDKDFSVASFTNYDTIVVNDHLPTVKQFFDEFSTMPVHACEFGFVASLGSNWNPNTDPGSPDYRPPVPMFGVSGYVEFVKPPRNQMMQPGMQKMYVPIVHISDVISLYPSPKILGMALPLIADVFMNRNGGLWKKQFDIGGRLDINIGNLVVNPETGKPFKVESRDQLDEVFMQAISPYPILVMDVRQGHASIPGINQFTYQPRDIAAEIVSFVNLSPEAVDGMVIADNAFREIDGVANDVNGNLIDTRLVTFLSRIPYMKREEIEYLLERDIYDQEARFKAIRSLTTNCTPTHGAWVVTLRPEFIKLITINMCKKLNVRFSQAAEAPKFNPFMYANMSYTPGGFGGQNFPDWSSRGFRY